jgi:hypothetical protein
MEVDCNYCPRPYLWTGLIREFAEDINNLDNSHKCSRQQAVLKMLYNNQEAFKGFLVRTRHILPSDIMCNGDKYKSDEHDLDKEIGKLIPGIPSGSAFKIYETVPQIFEVIFGAMVLLSLWLPSTDLWDWVCGY